MLLLCLLLLLLMFTKTFRRFTSGVCNNNKKETRNRKHALASVSIRFSEEFFLDSSDFFKQRRRETMFKSIRKNIRSFVDEKGKARVFKLKPIYEGN